MVYKFSSNLSVTAVCVNWVTFQRTFSIEGIQGMNDWKAWEPVHPMENGTEIEIGGEKWWKEIEISGENNWNLKK